MKEAKFTKQHIVMRVTHDQRESLMGNAEGLVYMLKSNI